MDVVKPDAWELVSPPLEPHVHDVLNNASEISRQELREFGLTNYDMTDRWRRGNKGEVLLIGGRAQCLLAHEDSPDRGEGFRWFWFVCTERFWATGPRGLKFTRDYLKRLRREHPGITFESFTTSQHEAMQRWFGVLGFEALGKHGNTEAFRLPPYQKQEIA